MEIRKLLSAKEREAANLTASKARALAGENNMRGQLAETQAETKKIADALASAKSENSRLLALIEVNHRGQAVSKRGYS